MQECVQPLQTQPINEHWQEVVKLQQKLHKQVRDSFNIHSMWDSPVHHTLEWNLKLMFFFTQEVKWAGKMQKMKEEHDGERSLVGVTGIM